MTEQIGIFGRIKRGWTIAMTGWHFILNNPSCLVFPIISSLVKTAFGFIAVIFYFIHIETKIEALARKTHLADPQFKQAVSHIMIPPAPKIIIGFVFLFVCILITSLMYTALSFYLAKKMENTPVSISTSIGRSFTRFKTLLVWSLINALLTIIFNMIRNAAKDDKFPFNLIAQLVAGFLQFAWNVLTFFVYPIFALKDLDAIASIEESGNTMKKMWGQSIGATFNISLISFLGFTVIVAPICLVSFLVLSKPLFVGVCVVTILIAAIIVNLWIATATTLFQTAAYLHTQGKQVGPFNTDFIQASFATTPSK